MTTTQVDAGPIVKVRRVALPVEQAFELFTIGMSEWWPVDTHSVAREAVKTIRFEGRVGGRVVEVANDGTEHSWGEVQVWDPPRRFAMTWYPSGDRAALTTLEVRFEPYADGGAEVTLEHRGWETLAAEYGSLRSNYDQGWVAVLLAFEDTAGR